MKEVSLTLPVPPSPNQWPRHPMERHRRKNTYRRQVWVDAIQQAKPMASPPPLVVLSARFFLHNLRDEDNLTGSLKWTLDALKQEQSGKMNWRQGVADRKGYIVDDDPKHLKIVKPTQEIDRDDPRLELTLRWNEQVEAA